MAGLAEQLPTRRQFPYICCAGNHGRRGQRRRLHHQHRQLRSYQGTVHDGNRSVGSGEVYESTFYQYDPYIDEEDYAAALDAAFIQAGFPSTLGFLIDTSRNGWGSSSRPTGPSSSTDLNTLSTQARSTGATTWASGATNPMPALACRLP